MIHEDLDWVLHFCTLFFLSFPYIFCSLFYILYIFDDWLLSFLYIIIYFSTPLMHYMYSPFFIVLSIFLNPKQYITLMLSSNSVSTFGYTWDVFWFDQLFNVYIEVLDLKIFWPEGMLRHQLSKCPSGAVKLEIFLLFIILIVLFNCELKFNFYLFWVKKSRKHLLFS